MRKQIKIQACSSPSIEDAFKDFLLHKKATGIAEKTLRSYSQQFSAVSKFIDSSVPIDQCRIQHQPESVPTRRMSSRRSRCHRQLCISGRCAVFHPSQRKRRIARPRWTFRSNDGNQTANRYKAKSCAHHCRHWDIKRIFEASARGYHQGNSILTFRGRWGGRSFSELALPSATQNPSPI